MFELRRFPAILPALLLASACAGANMTTYSPHNEKTKFGQDELFKAAREAVLKLGVKLQMADGVAHTVDTREHEVAISSIPRLSYKYSFHIETTNGTLSIEAKCVKNSAAKEAEYTDCGEDRPKQVIEEQDAIAKKTLELAPNQTSDSYDWSKFGKEPPPEPEKSEAKAQPKGGAKGGGKAAPKPKAEAAPAAPAAPAKSDDYVP
jgi:hypothetical protein